MATKTALPYSDTQFKHSGVWLGFGLFGFLFLVGAAYIIECIPPI